MEKITMNDRIKNEVERLRSIARKLSYDETEDANVKHVLFEVASRLESNWYEKNCRDPEHDAPILLYVPSGQVYKHVCPSCGNVIRISGTIITAG